MSGKHVREEKPNETHVLMNFFVEVLKDLFLLSFIEVSCERSVTLNDKISLLQFLMRFDELETRTYDDRGDDEKAHSKHEK
jgi:hypothetical protein